MRSSTRLFALKTDGTLIPSRSATSSPDRPSRVNNWNAFQICDPTRRGRGERLAHDLRVELLLEASQQVLVCRDALEQLEHAVVAAAGALPLAMGEEFGQGVPRHRVQPAAEAAGRVVGERAAASGPCGASRPASRPRNRPPAAPTGGTSRGSSGRTRRRSGPRPPGRWGSRRRGRAGSHSSHPTGHPSSCPRTNRRRADLDEDRIAGRSTQSTRQWS